MPNINEFKSRLRGGGARANQFKVTLPFPGYAAVGGETSDLAFLCKATAIPGQTVGNVPIDFRGRKLNIAGDRTFEPWSITVLNDTDFKLYRGFERWMNGINNMTDNEGIANPADYQVDGFVDHLDRNEFRADIFVKPARSINFIQLNFIATRTGVAFTEVAGA